MTTNYRITLTYTLGTWERIARGSVGFGWLLLICCWPLISNLFHKPLSDIVFLIPFFPTSVDLAVESINGTGSFQQDV
jgi:hypothetical protein